MEGFVIDRLRATLQDRVTTPADVGYDAVRMTFNATVQRRPAVIVRVRSDEDVVAAIAAAGDPGLPIAVCGGGHSVAGHAMADGAPAAGHDQGARCDPENRFRFNLNVAPALPRIGRD